MVLVIGLIISCLLWSGRILEIDSFAPAPSAPRTASRTSTHFCSKEDATSVERVRCAVFQSPAQSGNTSENPLGILTEVADALRVASLHGVDVVLFPELYLSGPSHRPIDRESYELNILENLCAELNVACLIGYAEKVHESESVDGCDPAGEKVAYNSIAAFHADGARAGNYRSVSAYNNADKFRKGHPFVEFLPTTLQLPKRQTPSECREMKVGLICGSDIVSPEHCRYLVRCGAQAIFAASSFRKNDKDLNTVKYAIPSRAIENQVPFIFANMEQSATVVARGSEFVGSSSIVSQDGDYLVCGPEEEAGDMPFDRGYLVPCTAGTLYAADVGCPKGEVMSEGGDGTVNAIQQSIAGWDLNPLMPHVPGAKLGKENQEIIGFGRQSRKKARRRS